jgi:hypothetical protein
MKFDRNFVGTRSDPAGSDSWNPVTSVRISHGSYRIPIGRIPIVRSDRITTPSDEIPDEFHRILSESDEIRIRFRPNPYRNRTTESVRPGIANEIGSRTV